MIASASTPSHLKATTQSRLHLTALLLAVVSASSVLASAEPALRMIKGNNQQTVYASAFAVPLTVQVVDSVTKQPIAGVRVDFSAAQGISLNAPSEITNVRGIAAVSAIGTSAGASAVSAQIAGQPASQVQFGNLAVDKAILTVVPGDINVTIGAGLPAITEYAIRGFVNGDTEATAQISGDPNLTTTAKENSPRENYAIKGGVGTLYSPNYTFVAGFGTLAVIGAPETLTEITPAQQFGLNSDMPKKAAEIRAALADQPVAVPAFLAGLRGESGVFVQKAIWQAQAAHPATAPNAVRNAMVPKIAAAAPMAAVPVRAAVTPKAVASPVPVATVVRSVALAHPAQTALTTSNVSAIRKAFNPPGTK
jgi:hypothetical protein